MVPLSPAFTTLNLPKVPVILVGQALENCHPLGPAEDSRWDNRPVQLWKVRVKVEQVVQGEVPPGNLDIFYFVDLGFSSGGWSRLMNIHRGHSEIFFLQKDGNRWRTICDGWRSCVLWVRTGTHYNYKIDSTLPIEDTLVNLALSRGEQTSDGQMIDAIYHTVEVARWGWTPVINRLQQLANEDQSPPVRAVALENLRKLQEYYGNGSRLVPQN